MEMPTDFKGAYLPTTQIWDAAEVSNANINDASKDVLVSMYQRLSNMAMMINDKETALYPLGEFVNGKKYFPNPTLTSSSSQTPKMRQGFIATFLWKDSTGVSTLPNAAVAHMAHNITCTSSMLVTNIWAGSSDTVAPKYIKLPFVADAGDDIAIWADGTNIYIDVRTTDRRNFNVTMIFMEYIKF
jgi:hypothetical protein